MELIDKYFPEISPRQRESFAALKDLYSFWNEKINVISRKDMEHFYERHVVHSLSITKLHPLKKGMKVMDIGTGGGFPGIPLAIYYPHTEFHLVDSIGKKIKVCNEIRTELGLENVKTSHERAENIAEIYDVITSRAVARIDKLLQWSRQSSDKKTTYLFLKGGDLKEEIKECKRKVKVKNLDEIYDEPFFETKCLLSISKHSL